MNILDKVKAVFLSETPAVIEVNFESFDTSDGRIIEVEAIEVGKAVMIDGAIALEGDIVLADGLTLKIDADGNIGEIVEAPADVAAEMSGIEDTRIADLESTLILLAERINAIEGSKATAESEMSAIKAANEKLSKENEALKIKPASAPAKFSKIEVKPEPRKLGDFTDLLKKAAKK